MNLAEKTLQGPVWHGMAGRVAEIPVEAGGESESFGGQRERGQEEFRGVVFRDNKFVERETPPDPFLLEG